MLCVLPVFSGMNAGAQGVRDPSWTTGALSNGIRYFIRPNDKPEDRVELRLVVNAGSVLEAEDQRGLAHVLEHAAFNGTTHFEEDEMVKFLESLGMAFGPDLNAYTSFDETVYKLKVPTDDSEVVEKAYLILSDWAGGITASDEALADERGVVIEEWRGRRGARARVRDRQFPVMFPGSRYAERLPIGTLEVLKTFEFERVRDFYRDWYRPELMSVVAVGDLDVEETEERIREYFGGLESRPETPERKTYTHPPHGETMVGTFSDPELTSSEVMILWKMPPRPTLAEADYREDVKEALIVSMLGERYGELTQRADAPFLNAGAYRGSYTRGGGVFLLYATVKNEAGAYVEGATALLRESERARVHGFTRGELERAKLRRLRAVEQAYQERNKMESERLAAEVVDHALTGEIVLGIERELEIHRDLLPTVTLEELQVLFHSWISDQNRVIMAEGPSENGETKLPEDGRLLAVFERVEAMELEPFEEVVSDEPLVKEPPEPGTVVERSEIPELGVTEWTLSNGVRVVLKPTDFKQDQILLSAWSPGGTSLAPLGELAHARLADTVASATGMGEFSAVDLQKKLAGKLVSLAPFIGRDRQGVNGSSSPRDLEALLQLVYLRYTAPREGEDAFQALKERLNEEVRNRLADPKEVFNDLFRMTLDNYHPRIHPLTLEDVDQLDMRKALKFFSERFANASGATFYLTGNIDPASAEPLVLRWLGSLPSEGGAEAPDYFASGFPEYGLRRTLARGMEPVGEVRMVWSTSDFEWNYASRHALQSLTSALSIRLREVLREEKGGTYHVSVWPMMRHRPVERAQLVIAFGCDPQRVEELIEAVRGVVDEVVAEPLEERYVTTVRETQRNRREVDLKQNSFWNSVLPFYDWHGEDPRTLNDFEEYVSSLTAEQIRETAEKYFGVPHRAVFVLLPREKETGETSPAE